MGVLARRRHACVWGRVVGERRAVCALGVQKASACWSPWVTGVVCGAPHAQGLPGDCRCGCEWSGFVREDLGIELVV